MSRMRATITRSRGVLASRFVGNRGDLHAVQVTAPADRASLPYRGLLVRGGWRSVRVPDGAELTPLYVAPARSVDRPPFATPGMYVVECTEDGTEYVCLQPCCGGKYMESRYVVGVSGPFVLPLGYTLIVGSGAAAARGAQLGAGSVVLADSADVDVVPSSPVFGVMGRVI